MEDNVQTIIVIIISAFLLFIFPVYMAYEKKDDISYALAMRYTQDLVDEVRGKGYITRDMYDDYQARLKVTGNSYDIQMTHEYNRYDPITNYYKIEDMKYSLVKTTTQEERKQYEQEVVNQAIELGRLYEDSSKSEIDEYIASVYESQNIHKVEDTYKISKQTYTTNHILNILNSERKLLLNANEEMVRCSDESNVDLCQYAYTMNVDDNFNITIKNTNTTLATVIYNMVTANTLDKNTRIYVNYGGNILSSKWFQSIDYSKMKHDNLSLDKYTKKVVFSNERKFVANNGTNNPVEKIVGNYDEDYAIAFDVKPSQITDLREKGKLLIADYTKYNFAAGNSKSLNQNYMMSISVGINGISLVTNMTEKLSAKTTQKLNLPEIYYTNSNGEQEHGGRRQITEYSKLKLEYVSKGRIKVTLTGKAGVNNYSGYITVSDPNNLLAGLNKTINNPTSGTVTGRIGQVANRGTNIKYTISIENSAIGISAEKSLSNEMTILSYPMTINGYTNVKVEVKKNEAEKHVAYLYIDGEKVDESIEMTSAPKVDVIGMTYIGNEERYFQGDIKNVELYY